MQVLQPIATADGSHTLSSAELGESYHSLNGALQESLHVFINEGFKQVQKQQVSILEVGLGTGLNALLTLIEAEKAQQRIYYECVEMYPLSLGTVKKLNYAELLKVESSKYFLPIHSSPWNKEVEIASNFAIFKRNESLVSSVFSALMFDLVYFDAFAPDVQPELWSAEVFSKIYGAMANGGMLVTYSAKGFVKRNLRSAGFTIYRLPGAAGKRHMLRAVKS